MHYVIHIPRNHPSGTFWYHAHVHGSTALQVASGMEGALIIEDRPNTTPSWLAAATARQKIFVSRRSPSSRARTRTGNRPTPTRPPAAATARARARWFPPTTPPLSRTSSRTRASGHETVNGQLVPVITMQPGEVQRWRFIDAAFRASIHLELVSGSGAPQPLDEIALDGLYTGRVDTWGVNPQGKGCSDPKIQGITPGSQCKYIDLEPGYRSDVLFQAPRGPERTSSSISHRPPTPRSSASRNGRGDRHGEGQGRARLELASADKAKMAPLAYAGSRSTRSRSPANRLWTPPGRRAASPFELRRSETRGTTFTVNDGRSTRWTCPRYLVLNTIGKWTLVTPPRAPVCLPQITSSTSTSIRSCTDARPDRCARVGLEGHASDAGGHDDLRLQPATSTSPASSSCIATSSTTRTSG